MIVLVMNPGLPGEQQFSLTQGAATIGRTKDNAVHCLHKSLSRRHAEIEVDRGKVKVTDLQSKNGVFVDGKRVSRCELVEGDSFRCGDVTFLIESSTRRIPGVSRPAGLDRTAQTLPSPLIVDPKAGRQPVARAGSAVTVEEDQRYKDKLFLLIRATELCVSDLDVDRVLEEIVALAVQVLEVDRIALLTLDEITLEMKPRVIRTPAETDCPISDRVVNWVVDHGSPASFADVARDRTLPGDLSRDASVRGAMCVPINPGGGTIGVIYADSLSRADCFRPDDLALLRALANLTAVAIESAALRASQR